MSDINNRGTNNQVAIYVSLIITEINYSESNDRVTNIQPTKTHHTSTTIPMVPSTTMMLRATLPTKGE